MKKLKLNELNFGNNTEVLSREELKMVFGGMGSGPGGGGSGSGSGSECSDSKCGGGDHSSWSTSCVVKKMAGQEYCACPDSNASWDYC